MEKESEEARKRRGAQIQCEEELVGNPKYVFPMPLSH